MTHTITAGSPSPPGVTPDGTGVNVAVFSANATRIDVCLFDAQDREIISIPLPARTGDWHHGHIAGVAPGARYGLRAHGPFDPHAGHRFNPAKLLLDPYAETLDRRFDLHPAMFGYRKNDGPDVRDDTDSAPFMPKAIVTARSLPGAPGALRVPWRDTVIYELNVRGFTMRHPDVPQALRGTFAGLGHPAAIAHLKNLGVTTVELMPAMAWIDERHLPPLGLTNAWGYNPAALCAPEPKLAPGGWPEVRAAVDALHDAGIEAILDVVLNHSGESDELGPTIGFRGLDNAAYYRLRPDDPARYIDDMGCGNCLALDRAPVADLALHALKTWVRRAGFDGFRFDLATAMGRRPDGFDPHAPLIAAITQDPELSGLKLIAEAWDIGPGGYQVGRFPASWGEWNDRYRDTARRFWRGESHLIGDLATRLSGSSDLFSAKDGPARGVNFITAHDGLTLADVVAYETKRNEANGEHDRDGTNANHSWNHGVEGPTDDPLIIARRRRDQINLLATLLLSRGTPMLSMGSEFGHSQRGNNNAYAQDNAIGWLGWDNADEALLAAASALVAARREVPLLRDDRFLTGQPGTPENEPDARWLRPDGAPMQEQDWNHWDSGTLLLQLAGGAGDSRALLAFHRRGEPCAMTLPSPRPQHVWTRWIDTSLPPTAWADTAPCEAGQTLAPRSVTLFRERTLPGARHSGPAPDAVIAALAGGAGIYGDWWDHSGQNHPVTPASKRTMLAAMGIDVSGEGAARDALEAMAQSERRAIPQSIALREGAAISLALGLSHAGAPAPRRLAITGEDGLARTVALDPAAGGRREIRCRDGRLAQVWQTRIDPLPVGRYTLRRDDAPDAACHLTVAQRTCFLPPEKTPGFGVSAQLYTLRRAGDQGIGDFTTLAHAGALATSHGASAFGINPLHALFPLQRDRASPYHPSDRRFLDPVYIDLTDLEWLPASPEAARLMAASAALFTRLNRQRDVDYGAVADIKYAVLHARFAAFREAYSAGTLGAAGDRFAAFLETGGDALTRFATFRAIEAKHAGKPWQQWPGGLAQARSEETAAFAQRNAGPIGFECFQQWLCEEQFARAAETARTSGLSIGFYRDLAVGCAPDGAEAWASDGGLVSGVSVGAPPDPFSATGQIWNLPPPSPLAMAADGCAAFRALIAANMRHAGMLRIDHVMGLARLFWVPDGARATEGAYVAYPRDALLVELALESQRQRCIVVGEDLGTVPEGFREALADSGVLSYRVLWFERAGQGFLPPHAYPADAVACVSTHDLATLAGWWSGADIAEQAELGLISAEAAVAASAAREAEKKTLASHLAAAGLPHAPDFTAPVSAEFAAAVHAFIAQTPCRLAFAQADDLAGEADAVNLPGTDRERPNWRRKLQPDIAELFDSPLAKAILAPLTQRKTRP